MEIKRGGRVNKGFNSPDYIEIDGLELNVSDPNSCGFMCDTVNRKMLYTPKGCDHQTYFMKYTKHFFPNLKGNECLFKAKEIYDSFDLQGRIWLNVGQYDGVMSTWNAKINKEVFEKVCEKFNLKPSNVIYTYNQTNVFVSSVHLFNKLSDKNWAKSEECRNIRDIKNAEYNKQKGYSCDAERHFKETMDENTNVLENVEDDKYMLGTEGENGGNNMEYSHVITEAYNGETMTVYHGSAKDFERFSISDKGLSLGNVFGKGVYTSTIPKRTLGYIMDKDYNACDGWVYELAIPKDNGKNYLDSSKPIPKMLLFKLLYKLCGIAIKKEKFQELWKEFFDMADLRFQEFKNAICYALGQNSQIISHILRQYGFYGIKVPNANDTWYIVFYPQDVKIVKRHQVKYNDTTFKRDLYMTENLDTEMVAFHGSASKFKNFDLSFIGTGEGAQYYGYGVYVSDCKHTGELYADVAFKNKSSEVSINKYKTSNIDEKVIVDTIYTYQIKIQNNGENPHFKKNIINEIENDIEKLESEYGWYEKMDLIKDYNKTLKFYQKILNFINDLKSDYITLPKCHYPQKYLYQVEIPEDNGENYIPFIGYSNLIFDVKNQLIKHLLKLNPNIEADLVSFKKYCQTFDDMRTIILQYSWMSDKEISEFLYSCGYVGIKVPTGARHGGDGNGTNFVIFNPNDIKIINQETLQENKILKEGNFLYPNAPDLCEISVIEYETYIDEDDYNEYLTDNNLQDSDEIRKQYFNEEVYIDLTFYDYETSHYMGQESMQIDDIKDIYGDKLADIIFNNCYNKFEYKGQVETISLVDEIDLSDDAQVYEFCSKYMPTGDYFKGCRGFILYNGVIVYTEQEHNDILMIPNLESKFDFITMGNIRIMPNSIDIGQCPTYAQCKVLKTMINEYSDDELYLDIWSNDNKAGCKYDYPDADEVIADIYRFYQEGIKPMGGHGNMRNDLYENNENEIDVYHGSRKDFDKFNHKKYLSTGTGTQSFGWGTYVTDDYQIALGYANIGENHNKIICVNDEEINNESQLIMLINDTIRKYLYSTYPTIESLMRWNGGGWTDDYTLHIYEEIIIDLYDDGVPSQKYLEECKTKCETFIAKPKWWENDMCIDIMKGIVQYVFYKYNTVSLTPKPKMIYEVTIPDDNGVNYLEWYKPLNFYQYMTLNNALTNLLEYKHKFSYKIEKILSSIKTLAINDKMAKNTTFEQIYRSLVTYLKSQKAVSLLLMNCGFDGIKYPSGTKWSKPNGAKDDGMNYVIFDANKIKITTKKNINKN